MMDAGQTFELPDELLVGCLAGWLGDKRRLGLGQARERDTGAAQGEHFVGCGVGGLVLVPWGDPLSIVGV
jgi:hypothetical protein